MFVTCYTHDNPTWIPMYYRGFISITSGVKVDLWKCDIDIIWQLCLANRTDSETHHKLLDSESEIHFTLKLAVWNWKLVI